MPRPPNTPDPPPELLRLADSLSHPSVTRTGLTTTEEGEWALKVRVPRGTAVPLRDLEAACQSFPVVYDEEPEELPVARPAFPGKGE
jgi:hypothetical protein